MISYAASLACFGSYMTPELSAAFRQAKIRNVEVSLEIFANDNQYTRESRANTLELIRQKVIRPVSAHLPFGGVWDISALNDERRRCAVSLIVEPQYRPGMGAAPAGRRLLFSGKL